MLAVPPTTVNLNPCGYGQQGEESTGLRLKLAVVAIGPYDGGMLLNVDRCGSGLTAEEFLLRQIPAAPPSYVRQLFRQHKVLCEGSPLVPEAPLNRGVSLQLPGSERLQALINQGPALAIVHETDRFMVLDKPAGLATHRTSAAEPDLTTLLQELTKRRKQPYRIAPVTRLDRGTSGLVIFAKGKQSASELGQQIMDHRWRKLYLALVQGNPPPEGALENPVAAKGKIKPSRALFRRLHAQAGFALLEVDLQTGRTHQIRQQFASSGYPLVGDLRYGFASPGSPGRMFLHCTRLELPETGTANAQIFSAPLPQALKTSLKNIWSFDRT